jgi:hypothetical protein
MSQLETLPAPVLGTSPDDKWRREQRAFRARLPELLERYRDLYVAVHESEVVESGTDKLEVAGKAYAKFRLCADLRGPCV